MSKFAPAPASTDFERLSVLRWVRVGVTGVSAGAAAARRDSAHGRAKC
jgi:hypothetical protein